MVMGSLDETTVNEGVLLLPGMLPGKHPLTTVHCMVYAKRSCGKRLVFLDTMAADGSYLEVSPGLNSLKISLST